MEKILQSISRSSHVIVSYFPTVFAGLMCFIPTLAIAGIIANMGTTYSFLITKYSLMATFILWLIGTLIFLRGTVLTLELSVLSSVSDKILAFAGITIIIGFALKGIFENFLAGLIFSFSKTNREFSMIECEFAKNMEINPAKDFVNSLSGEKTNPGVIFWFNNKKFAGLRSVSKSEIIVKVFDRVADSSLKYSGKESE